MSKNNKLAVIIILLLAVAFLSSIYLNQGDTQKRKELLSQAKIEVLKGDESSEISLSDIENVGEETFVGVFDSSSSSRSEHEYTGIELKDLVMSIFGDVKDKKAIIVHGADGFSVAYSMEEVLLDKNVYLVYMEDGKYLGGRESGGRGPYETIIVSDTFSNRRCKWVVKIEVME